MKVLVLGSEGFLGSHIMEQGRLLKHNMTGCDRVGKPDILDQACFVKVDGYDRVIHAAGALGTSELLADPLTAIDDNISETVIILQNCLQARVPLTYCTLTNEWLNPYSITKNCAAQFVNMYHQVHGLPTQVAHLYNLFGPRQKWKPIKKIVPEFMTRLIQGLPVQLYNGGEQFCDMCYAPDMARAILHDTGTGEAHYGSGVGRFVKDVAKDCANALGVPIKVELLGRRSGETGPASIAEYASPNQMPYYEALKHTADWYKENFRP